MSKLPDSGLRFFKMACYFEASLAVTASVLGWLFAVDPFAELFFSETALWYGGVATLPLLILFFAIQAMPYQALVEIRSLLKETLGVYLRDRHWSDLLVLAAIAGFSEELLFRGLIQPGLEQAWGMQTGLWASSLIFALAHAVTPWYAILAFLMSLYLGISMDFGGERNLLTPMVIHGFYDFVAFMVIAKHSFLGKGSP
jgi:membrane protease YdiL (CAAX protease family)